MGRGSEDINEGFHYSGGQDDPFWGCQLVSFLGQSSAYSTGPQTKFYGNKYGNRAQQHGCSLTNANLATATVSTQVLQSTSQCWVFSIAPFPKRTSWDWLYRASPTVASTVFCPQKGRLMFQTQIFFLSWPQVFCSTTVSRFTKCLIHHNTASNQSI